MDHSEREDDKAEQSRPGFGRDAELEETRSPDRPANSDLSATKDKAEREPTIHYAPDPDKGE